MILLCGRTCGDSHSFDYTPTSISKINKITIKNGIYNDTFVSKNVTFDYNETSKSWDYDTVIYALFQNNLTGGNVSFTSDTVSAIRVKRRKQGDFSWDTLFEVPITINDDFNFERFDRYARGNTTYEYSLVPIINNAEGNFNTNSIESEFEGFYLVEKDVIYRAYLNAEIPNVDRNHNSVIIQTLGRKYPFNISNGSSNYESGQLNATFINTDLNNNFDLDNAWKFRNEVNDFLTNGKPKILKTDEGRMWMVSILDNIPQKVEGHYQNVIHTISWAEVGDAESTTDLYLNDFIDIDSRTVR